MAGSVAKKESCACNPSVSIQACIFLRRRKIPGRDYIPAHDAFIQISWDQLGKYT